jgi:hypothetical protein
MDIDEIINKLKNEDITHEKDDCFDISSAFSSSVNDESLGCTNSGAETQRVIPKPRRILCKDVRECDVTFHKGAAFCRRLFDYDECPRGNWFKAYLTKK